MALRTPRTRRKRQPRQPRGTAEPVRRRGCGRILFRLGLWALVLGALGLGVLNLIYSSIARGYPLEELERLPERSTVYDRHGNVLGKIHGEDRIVVKLADIAPSFIEALLAREDDRFRSHGGVDWRGVLRAAIRNVKDGTQQGASTITMQLARTSYGLPQEKSIHRKLLEIAITRRIEEHRSKDQILELYVNRIFFGTGMHGVERAAQAYFGKKAKALTLDESAMLAAIIRGPNIFSPFRHYDTAVSGRNMVLDRMVATGRLTADEAARAKTVKTRVLPQPAPPPDNWVLDAVRRELTRLMANEEVANGGLNIHTSIDPALQQAAERALEQQLAGIEALPDYAHPTRAEFVRNNREGEPDYLQGAVLVLENETGAVRAAVGGRDVTHTSYNRALQAQRPAGSTFKPFVYAAALERGLRATTPVDDGPLRPGEIPAAPDFQPQNSDGRYTGMQPAEWGLIASRNTMTVRVGEMAGMTHVLDLAAQSGLDGITSRSPQVYLGNVDVTLQNMTSALSSFPAGGSRCRPFLIQRVTDAAGTQVYRASILNYEVMSAETARSVRGMLERVLEPGGTAAEVRRHGLRGPAGGKTGTTDDFRDAWFVGFSPRLTCGVWIGLDARQSIIERGTGSRLAVPVWEQVMQHALSRTEWQAAAWPGQ